MPFGTLSKKWNEGFKEYEANKPKPPAQPVALTAPTAPAPAAPAPPPRRELGPLPTLQKTAVERLILDRTGVDKQFAANRQRVQQQEGAQVQQGRDALARRAAQLGGGPGGAFIKQEQRVMDESAERLGQANMEIDAAKDAEYRRMGELETQLNLQKEEAQAARDMATWQTELQTALQKYGVDVQADQWEADYAAKQGAQSFLEKQTGFENEENLRTNIISTIISLKNSGIPPDQVGGILSSIGYDYESLGIDPAKITGVQGLTAKAPDKKPAANLTAPSPGAPGGAPPEGVKLQEVGRGVYRGSDGYTYKYNNGKLERVSTGAFG